MKLGHLPEPPLEAVALACGLVSTPVLDTLIALLLAQSVITATRRGVFEALEDGPWTRGRWPRAATPIRRRWRSCLPRSLV
jgi:hypothetical protein